MSTFDLASFKTDTTKEAEGVWVDFGGGAEFKIASLNNPQFQKAFSAKKAPYDKQRKEMTDEQMLEVMVHCIAKYVVLDWKNVFEDEKILKHSPENAVRVLTEITWLRDRVIEESRSMANYVADVDEEIEKN